ncbi:enoyl-ACP reductase FabI [Streptomyces sp. NPDC057193]|uniref:enoyl-ACP reductase FabI n=1 Tax=unclassified Streptomyces TaxID=2593676 RepID=UPI003625CB3B
MLDFAGRRYLITGVLNEDSIAWHTAAALQQAGAEIVLTGFGRSRRITESAAASLDTPPDVLELDVTRPEDFTRLAEDLDGRWGSLDGVLHAVAAAPQSAISGNFLTADAESAAYAFHTSAYSLHALTTSLAPLLGKGSGSVVGLDFDSTAAWPGYDWMGVSKAALGAVCRYLALYLGPAGIRVNLVAAGPVETVAGRGISTFDRIADRWEAEAPLGWDRADVSRLTGPVLFLLSDLSATVTGEILHADGGMHAVHLGNPPAAPTAPGATQEARR